MPACTRSSAARSRPSSIGTRCPRPRALVRVVPAALGVNAPLVGAAEMAFEPLLSDPAAWFGRPNHTLHLASA